MRFHILLLFLLLITPLFSAYGYRSTNSYNIETPWMYSSWRCNNSCDIYGVVVCESKQVRITNWPYRVRVCHSDGDGGQDCAWECRRTVKQFSLGSLGYRSGAWSIDKFENALDELELDVLKGEKPSEFVPDYEGYSIVTSWLDLASTDRANALNYANKCKDSSSYSAHNKIVNQGWVCSTGPIDITFADYRAIMTPRGSSAPFPCPSDEPGAEAAGIYCKSYSSYWQNSVIRAFQALAYSFSYTDSKIENEARPLWNRMENSGICDDDYDWDTGEGCDDMGSAFNIVDTGITEGTYGQYNSAKNYLKGLKKDAGKYPPELGNYTKIMKLLWRDENGTVALFTQVIEDGTSALDEAENIYNGFISDANSHKTEVNRKYSEMESDKLSKIQETLAVKQIDEESIGTIAERFSAFKGKKIEAGELILNASRTHARTSGQGYLKTATRNAYDAMTIYGELADSADRLLDDADEVVAQQREQTLTVLNQAESIVERNPSDSRASSIYHQARSLFNSGEASSVLGDKFDYYVRAESYAWQVLEEQMIVTNETGALLLQIDDLIRRAEMDEINVASEEAMLRNLEGEKDSRDISGDLRALTASILEKADIKYGHLLGVRAELLANISGSDACGADLKTTMENIEAGIISGRTIDYMNGIGRLKSLEESYSEISDELSLCESNIIANSLVIRQSIYVERVRIDEPVPIVLDILISNPTYYSGDEVSVDIPLQAKMQLLYSDITQGQEYVANVLVDDYNLVLTLASVSPYWTRSIEFEKDAVLAHTISSEKTAKGIGDGKARVEETRIFTLDADDVYIDMGDSEIVDMAIDGRSTDSLLDSGEHALSLVYIVDDAYEINRTDINAAPAGFNTQLTYKISVMPSIDIDTLPVTVDLEYQNISGISISTLTGASLVKEDCGTGYCDLELSGLEAGEETLVSVSYMIVNTDESDASAPLVPDGGYCIEGVGKECDPVPAEFNQTVAMINAATERGDYASAIELKEKLKDDISSWWSEQQSLAEAYGELLGLLENEKSEIESALSLAGTADDSLIDNMKNRKSEIEDALSDADSAVTLRNAVSSLESPDPGWKGITVGAFRESSWNEYNSLKKRLFDAGVTDMPSEFIDVENKINALAATGGLEDSVKLLLSLENAEEIVRTAEAGVADEVEELRIEFQDTKENITTVLETYRGQQDAAKGTPWETMFSVDTSGIESMMDEIEEMLGKEDNRLVKKKMEILENRKDKVVRILEQLKDESERMMEGVQSSFEAKKQMLSQGVITTVEKGLESMAAFISGAEYISALKAGEILVAELEGYSVSGEGVNPVLLVLAVVSVIAAVGVYYYKFRKGDGENELSFLKKQKKEYRKLERAEQ